MNMKMIKKFKGLSTGRKISFVIFFLLTIFVLWFIFFHSAKPATESSADSEGLSQLTADVINHIFGSSLTSEDTVWWVRTFAHFSEFAALSFCFSASLESIANKNRTHFRISLPFTLLVSFCDEILQTFYEGRAFQISDIFVDITGGLCGIIFFSLILKIFFGSKKAKNG